MKNKSEFLTTGDVARSCQVTTNAVKKWIREKNLPAFKTPGGHFRIRAEDFQEFIARYRMPIAGQASRPSPPKILVVDDDADLLQLLVMALADAANGFTVESATDGYEALIAIGRFKPDLLVLDLKMPRIDGLEVCRRLKASPETSNIAILVMTGFPGKQDVKKLSQWNVDQILAKPFAVEELIDQIRKILPPVASAGAAGRQS